jgi:glycerate kinase
VSSVFGEAVEIRELPMADGGEGTLDALVAAWGGRVETVATTDALGRPCTGRIGFGASSAATVSAIIETADANGLPAVSDRPLQPLDADSYGVGTLIVAALDAGAEELLLCLGGSATNDGGAGMLRALGARLLDAEGRAIEPGARGLARLHEVELSGLDPRAERLTWRIACDVDNPLLGARGAAAVFGPQKGATPDDVERIDRGLERLLLALAGATGAPADALRAQEGLGAAGGLSLGPLSIFGAQLMPGARLVSEAIGLRDALRGAAFAITGEGRLDSQSVDGKVVSQVLADAEPGTPVFVIAGSVGLTAAECREAGVAAAFSLAQGPAELSELQAGAVGLLEEAAAQLAGVLAGPRHAAVAASELAPMTTRISTALPGQPNEL